MAQNTGKTPAAPNVIVVLTTQWRGTALGVAGDPNARTPRLDALARESVWLRQAVTPHPFGVFARAALLTGRRCPGSGIRDYYDPLPADAWTLAHGFGEIGYDTAFFGKWQLYERDPSAPVVGEEHARIVVPSERRGGFGFWEGFESGFLLNDPLLHGTELASPTRFEGYQSDVLMERFLRFYERRSRGCPLFSFLSLDAPHPPYAASAAGVEPLEPERVRLLKGTSADESTRAAARSELAGYYAHIEATDRAIGRAIDALRARGDWENTIFVFSSAHGDMHGVAGKFRKGWPDECSTRVPLVISWPSRLAPREDDRLLFSLLDLGPSLIGLAAGGAAVAFRDAADGLDLSACLLDEALPGPAQQELSMPSVPPFPRQCPYAWLANRNAERTVVFPEEGESYELSHFGPQEFE